MNERDAAHMMASANFGGLRPVCADAACRRRGSHGPDPPSSSR